MSRIVNDDPASLAVAASVARRGAIGIGEASAELATLTRLLSEQWLGPQARRTRRELAVIIATADALSAELRLVSGAMHDLTSTSAQLRAEEARAREAAGPSSAAASGRRPARGGRAAIDAHCGAGEHRDGPDV